MIFNRIKRRLNCRKEKKRLRDAQWVSHRQCYIHDHNNTLYVFIDDIPTFKITDETDISKDEMDLRTAQAFMLRMRKRYVDDYSADGRRRYAACM